MLRGIHFYAEKTLENKALILLQLILIGKEFLLYRSINVYRGWYLVWSNSKPPKIIFDHCLG